MFRRSSYLGQTPVQHQPGLYFDIQTRFLLIIVRHRYCLTVGVGFGMTWLLTELVRLNEACSCLSAFG